jgi:hypothetical protein
MLSEKAAGGFSLGSKAADAVFQTLDYGLETVSYVAEKVDHTWRYSDFDLRSTAPAHDDDRLIVLASITLRLAAAKNNTIRRSLVLSRPSANKLRGAYLSQLALRLCLQSWMLSPMMAQ